MNAAPSPPTTSDPGLDEIKGFLAGRIPDAWFTGPARITGDRDEVLVVGTVPDVELESGATERTHSTARSGRIARFRDETKADRIALAREAEHRYGRKISWGAICGDTQELFTTLGVPVMSRLRLADRAVLDTLIDAGVARSRSEALAWCVRLVGKHQEDWINSLRDALVSVERVRSEGPGA